MADWTVLVLVHLHSTLHHIRALLFGEGAAPVAAVDVMQVTQTAESLFRVLALIASGNDELVRGALGDKADKLFGALLLSKGPDCDGAAAADAALASLAWLRNSLWLEQGVGRLPGVQAVFQRIGEEEVQLVESFQSFVHDHWTKDPNAWRTPTEGEADAERKAKLAMKVLPQFLHSLRRYGALEHKTPTLLLGPLEAGAAPGSRRKASTGGGASCRGRRLGPHRDAVAESRVVALERAVVGGCDQRHPHARRRMEAEQPPGRLRPPHAPPKKLRLREPRWRVVQFPPDSAAQRNRAATGDGAPRKAHGGARLDGGGR
jgi:hypothetical protein